MKYSVKRSIRAALALGFLVTLSIFVFAGENYAIADDVEDGRNEAREATETLRAVMQNSATSIPRALLKRAEAIAVFTNIKKGGFIVGGTGGDGVISRRSGNTWGPPVFYNVGGADVGFQIGLKKTDYILLFMQPGALKDLLDDELELGASLGLAAGPVGDSATISTGSKDAVLVYSNTDGAFAGATIGGATIKADNSKNQAFYKMNGGQVLEKPKAVSVAKLPAELRGFTSALAQYSK